MLPTLRNWLRGPYRKVRARYMRLRHGFGPAELLATLGQVEVRRGDAVLMHSTMRGFEGFSGSVSEVIAVLEEAIGPEGTLIMPTLSMSGSAVEFVQANKVFDVRTTPSQAGLLTEVFRRSPSVVRSLHPTHSVAVWGADTGWWIENHHLADSPCGRGSPYHRLLERNGKILMAGVGIACLTFFHCAEELIESRMPESPFTGERYVVKCKSGGHIIETAPMRLYAPELSRRRRLQPLEAELRDNRRWRDARIGTLNLIALNASDVLVTLEEMAGRGVFCYQTK